MILSSAFLFKRVGEREGMWGNWEEWRGVGQNWEESREEKLWSRYVVLCERRKN